MAGTTEPLVEELRPAPDPWEVARRLAHLPHLLFLDSARPGGALGRYSYVAADPIHWTRTHGSTAQPFALLSQLLECCTMKPIAELPPFQGGVAGLFGYDLGHHIERLPRPRFDEFAVPDLAVGVYPWVIAFDHAEDRAWIIAAGHPAAPAQACQATVRALLQRHTEPRQFDPYPAVTPAVHHPLAAVPGLFSNFTRPGFEAAIARGIEYIHAGDCFQVNLAQRLLHPATIAPLELYARLRQRNPAPFAGYFDLGDFVIASASPERFVRVQDAEVQTRPIKGTRPRGVGPEEDMFRAEDLLASVKDRAENVMIVDLLRNDLGRVCRYGTVKVDAVCRLESYQTVHHLVSEVRGTLREGLGPIDLLRASFPGGSVTGAPKVRAMEIIAELEPTARGAYCGSLGYIGFDGCMDTSILIRTFTIGKGWIQFPVGGGIVADSDPASEYAETLHKAEGLLRALG